VMTGKQKLCAVIPPQPVSQTALRIGAPAAAPTPVQSAAQPAAPPAAAQPPAAPAPSVGSSEDD
jgi:hypothetical protein